MEIIAILMVLFIIAIARGVPIWILFLTVVGIALGGIVADKLFVH